MILLSDIHECYLKFEYFGSRLSTASSDDAPITWNIAMNKCVSLDGPETLS